MEKRAPSYIADGTVSCFSHRGKLWRFLRKLLIKVELPYYNLDCSLLIIAILIDVVWCLTVALISISQMINGAEHRFICLLTICMSALKIRGLFGSPVHFITGSFLFLMVSHMSYLYILDINTLDVSFTNILPHSAACLFVLLIVSVAVQKLISLTESHFFLFLVLFPFPDGKNNQKIFKDWYQSIMSTFYSRSFMVSDVTFMSLIHFEFIFIYVVRKCSNFLLYPVF